MDIYSKVKVAFLRFLRGAVSGAVSTMVVIQFTGGNSFSDLKSFVFSLTIAGFIGAVTGGLMALDKYFRA